MNTPLHEQSDVPMDMIVSTDDNSDETVPSEEEKEDGENRRRPPLLRPSRSPDPSSSPPPGVSVSDSDQRKKSVETQLPAEPISVAPGCSSYFDRDHKEQREQASRFHSLDFSFDSGNKNERNADDDIDDDNVERIDRGNFIRLSFIAAQEAQLPYPAWYLIDDMVGIRCPFLDQIRQEAIKIVEDHNEDNVIQSPYRDIYLRSSRMNLTAM